MDLPIDNLVLTCMATICGVPQTVDQECLTDVDVRVRGMEQNVLTREEIENGKALTASAISKETARNNLAKQKRGEPVTRQAMYTTDATSRISHAYWVRTGMGDYIVAQTTSRLPNPQVLLGVYEETYAGERNRLLTELGTRDTRHQLMLDQKNGTISNLRNEKKVAEAKQAEVEQKLATAELDLQNKQISYDAKYKVIYEEKEQASNRVGQLQKEIRTLKENRKVLLEAQSTWTNTRSELESTIDNLDADMSRKDDLLKKQEETLSRLRDENYAQVSGLREELNSIGEKLSNKESELDHLKKAGQDIGKAELESKKKEITDYKQRLTILEGEKKSLEEIVADNDKEMKGLKDSLETTSQMNKTMLEEKDDQISKHKEEIKKLEDTLHNARQAKKKEEEKMEELLKENKKIDDELLTLQIVAARKDPKKSPEYASLEKKYEELTKTNNQVQSHNEKLANELERLKKDKSNLNLELNQYKQLTDDYNEEKKKNETLERKLEEANQLNLSQKDKDKENNQQWELKAKTLSSRFMDQVQTLESVQSLVNNLETANMFQIVQIQKELNEKIKSLLQSASIRDKFYMPLPDDAEMKLTEAEGEHGGAAEATVEQSPPAGADDSSLPTVVIEAGKSKQEHQSDSDRPFEKKRKLLCNREVRVPLKRCTEDVIEKWRKKRKAGKGYVIEGHKEKSGRKHKPASKQKKEEESSSDDSPLIERRKEIATKKRAEKKTRNIEKKLQPESDSSSESKTKEKKDLTKTTSSSSRENSPLPQRAKIKKQEKFSKSHDFEEAYKRLNFPKVEDISKLNRLTDNKNNSLLVKEAVQSLIQGGEDILQEEVTCADYNDMKDSQIKYLVNRELPKSLVDTKCGYSEFMDSIGRELMSGWRDKMVKLTLGEDNLIVEMTQAVHAKGEGSARAYYTNKNKHEKDKFDTSLEDNQLLLIIKEKNRYLSENEAIKIQMMTVTEIRGCGGQYGYIANTTAYRAIIPHEKIASRFYHKPQGHLPKPDNHVAGCNCEKE